MTRGQWALFLVLLFMGSIVAVAALRIKHDGDLYPPPPTQAVEATQKLLAGEPISWDDYHRASTELRTESGRSFIAKKLGRTEESLRFLTNPNTVNVTLKSPPSTRPAAK